MSNLYRVIKDNFLWSKGAILKENDGVFEPIMDIWNVHDLKDDDQEVITRVIIENSPEWFEKVYEINLLNKTVYKTKELAKEFYTKQYKD